MLVMVTVSELEPVKVPKGAIWLKFLVLSLSSVPADHGPIWAANGMDCRLSVFDTSHENETLPDVLTLNSSSGKAMCSKLAALPLADPLE